jgi:hypothetical protein
MTANFISTVISDFKEAVNFMTKEKPIILKVMLTVTVFNLFVTSMLIVGLPDLVTVTLGLSPSYNGTAHGIMFAGGILGGILVGAVAPRVPTHKVNGLLLASVLVLFPMCLALGVAMPAIASYILIVLSIMICMATSTIFSIIGLTFLQGETPNQLIGKVSAFIVTLSLMAQPVGQALYGFLFDGFKNQVVIVVFTTIVIGVMIVFVTRSTYASIKETKPVQVAN